VTEQKAVYMIVWIGTNSGCLGRHVTFHNTKKQAEQAIRRSLRRTEEGRLLLVQATILEEHLAGSWQ